MRKGRPRKNTRSSTPKAHKASPLSLLVATRNPGKLREIRLLLSDLDIDVHDLSDLHESPDVEETGTTLAQNALLKARTYFRLSGTMTLADDSGLEVNALKGAPGVYSARYGGPGATDADRIARLLEQMVVVPDDRRGARFVCVLALVGPPHLEETFTGVCEGRITREPLGEGGFGFDPVFEYPPLGRTFGQLSLEEKSSVSHRGRALVQLRQFMLSMQGDASA